MMVSTTLTRRAAVLASLAFAGTLHADINHRQAVDIARDWVPGGVVVEVEDETYDGVENTYEVELIINNGNKIADVEIDRVTGDVVQYDEINQTNEQRNHWQSILALVDLNTIDFRQARRKALTKYPDAAIDEIDLDLELGRLEFDVFLVDANGPFQVEIDAITGEFDSLPDRGLTYAEAIEFARAEASKGKVVSATYSTIDGDKRYVVVLTRKRGRKEITVHIDDQTGATLFRRTVNKSGAEREAYRDMLTLLKDAELDWAEAQDIAQDEAGNGRPTRLELDLSMGILEFKTKLKIANVAVRVWVDSITGDVTDVN